MLEAKLKNRVGVTRRYHERGVANVFGKVFASLWQGSLRGTGETWAVFVYLLANADHNGVVEVVPERIADDTGFGLDRVLEALVELKSPDPRSRTPDHDGRRIEPLDEHRDWGWIILNYAKYRAIKDAETVRAQTLERVRRHREKRARGLGAPLRTETETPDVPDEFVPLEGPVGPSAPGRKRARREEEAVEFKAFWDAYPRKVARRAAVRAFVSALGRHDDVEASDLVAAAGAFAKRVEFERREPQFIPHPTTWLNQDRFMEEFADDEATQG